MVRWKMVNAEFFIFSNYALESPIVPPQNNCFELLAWDINSVQVADKHTCIVVVRGLHTHGKNMESSSQRMMIKLFKFVEKNSSHRHDKTESFQMVAL